MQYKVFKQGFMGTNTTLLMKGNDCIVVDIAYNAHMVYSYINQNHLNLVAVLLTHGHFDHCGGVNQLFEKCHTKAPIYVHQADLPLCNNAAANIWRVPAENCFPTNFVEEGPLQIGEFNLEVLHTPGHTMGSVVYLVDDLMISGDTLVHMSVGRTDFPESVPELMEGSLQKLRDLQFDYTVIGGHEKCSTLNYEKENNPKLTALRSS